MLREGHEIANQSAPGGVKRHSSGVKHFPKGVKKNLGGGLTAPNPSRKSAHDFTIKKVKTHTAAKMPKSVDKPSTIWVRTACPKLSTSLEVLFQQLVLPVHSIKTRESNQSRAAKPRERVVEIAPQAKAINTCCVLMNNRCVNDNCW